MDNSTKPNDASPDKTAPDTSTILFFLLFSLTLLLIDHGINKYGSEVTSWDPFLLGLIGLNLVFCFIRPIFVR